MDNLKDKLLSMEIGVYQEITFSSGILKSTKELCRIEEGEWALESHSCGWSTAYLDLNKAVAYFEGKIKGYELDWEDNEIIL
tara:strand:- start:438 stop:683 length:246 start_codon:yes stop_codon:yes gene_type:complete